MIKLKDILNEISTPPKFNTADEAIAYINSWKFCKDSHLLKLLERTTLKTYFGKKKIRCPELSKEYVNAIENWLKLSDEIKKLNGVEYSLLMAGYCHQIANVILYEALFGSHNIGSYSGKMIELPIPNDINKIKEWFDIHYHHKNIVRQILFAVDNYWPVRIIEGKH